MTRTDFKFRRVLERLCQWSKNRQSDCLINVCMKLIENKTGGGVCNVRGLFMPAGPSRGSLSAIIYSLLKLTIDRSGVGVDFVLRL